MWGVFSRLREWIAVEDPDERIEGTGEAIRSSQHRRSREAEHELRKGDRYKEHDRE